MLVALAHVAYHGFVVAPFSGAVRKWVAILRLTETPFFETNMSDNENADTIGTGFCSRKPTPEERVEIFRKRCRGVEKTSQTQ